MKILRIIALLMGLLLLGGCAVGVEGELTDAATEPNETLSESADTEKTDAAIDLVLDGKAQFLIVSNGKDYIKAMESLKMLLDSKTGANFSTQRFDPSPDEAGKIYVGCSWCDVTGSDYIPKYGYYGVVWSNGNLYICGSTAAEIEKCVSVFAAVITKEHVTTEDGKIVQVSIPSTVLFLNEPGGGEDVTLLGESLRAYRIVHSANASGLEKYFVMCLQDQLLEIGYEVDAVTDATAPIEREIVIGNTTRAGSADFYGAVHELDDYAIVGKGTSLYVGYGSDLCLQKILSSISQAYDKDTVSITGDIDTPDSILKKNENDIRVMTANVLYADWQIDDAPYELRMEMTADYINLYRPDFVGLQEARGKNKTALAPHLAQNYRFVDFTNNDDSDAADKLEYLPVLYDSTKWTVVEARPGEWEHRLFCAWGYGYVKFARIGNESETFYLLNLHYMPSGFVGQGSYEPYGDLYRNDMAGYVSDEVERIVAADPDAMIAITGDYNAHRESDVFEIMYRNGFLETSKLLTQDINMVGWLKQSIDHISVTKEHTEVVLHRQIETFGSAFMSDHQYQFCDLRRKTAVSS